MYKCDKCGKEFNTSQGLGGHKSFCNSPVSGSPSLTKSYSTHSTPLHSTHSTPLHSTHSTHSTPLGIKLAEDTAKKYQLTGKHYGQVQVNWGRLLAALAIGGFVAWLVYKALENWDWKGGSSKKQISPYKLIGGLIQGLG